MPASNGDDSGDPRSDFREAGSHLSLALEPALTMVIWIVIGVLLDRWLDTTPWFVLAGLCLGLISMCIQLVRGVKKSESREKRRKKDPPHG